MYNKNISTKRITAHYTSLCHTGHNRPDGDRRQAHAYPRQRLSRVSFLHACKAFEGEYHHKYIHFQQQGKSQICIHANDHITWNNKSFKMRWCYKHVNKHTKNIMPGFRMLAFKVWKGRVHSKTFESFLLSLQSPILNKFELTHKSKTAQKVVLKNYQINLKIN